MSLEVYMKKFFCLLFLLLYGTVLTACQNQPPTTSTESEKVENEVTERTKSSIEEEETEEDAYIPGKVQFYDSEQKTMVDWVKPDNIDQYVGTYEGTATVADTASYTITLTITKEGYFTAFWMPIDNSYFHYFNYLTGVVTTTFNDVNLHGVASLYHYDWPEWNSSQIFDENGDFKNLDINGTVEKLKDESIWLDSIPLTDADDLILKTSQRGKFNLIDSNHARLLYEDSYYSNAFDLTRVDAPSEYTKQSVFQYAYRRLREMKTEKIENKYHLYQLLKTRRELSSELLYDSEVDKYLDYTGYDKAGNPLKMQFIVVEYSYYYGSTAYGYDGEKTYEGPIDEELKSINWEEYELPKDKVLKNFEN